MHAATPISKGKVAIWLVIPVSALVLYLLSVPVVTGILLEPKWVTGKTVVSSMHVADGWILKRIPPTWLQHYSRPYSWLRFNTPLRGPLSAYSDWCWRQLGES